MWHLFFFVANTDISLDIYETFNNFIDIQANNQEILAYLLSSPKINLSITEHFPITIKKGEIIYVGESKNLTSRYYQHMEDKLSKAASMKFKLRKKVFGDYPNRHFDTYIIRECESKKRTELERFIRNCFCLFKIWIINIVKKNHLCLFMSILKLKFL